MKSIFAVVICLFCAFIVKAESEKPEEITIAFINSNTSAAICERFKNDIKQNCILTTRIVKGTYQEYCLTTDCSLATISDMLAWLKQKENILAKIKQDKDLK